MTIRRTLLLFFLLMGLVPATALTGLAFFQARDALKQAITRNLNTQASALMEQINRMVYERALHVHTWSHLELMQEVRVGDVDKRLSHLLFELGKHYTGVYKTLQGIDREGWIVAASDPALIGKQREGSGIWLNAHLAYGEATLSPLMLGSEPGAARIDMEATIHDPESKESVGTLRVGFDWTEIFKLLDQSGKTKDAPPPLALLFDAQGRVIAASAPLRERGLLLSADLAGWRKAADQDAVVADPDARLGFSEVLAGSSKARGYQGFPNFGWTVQVYQPTALAFAPIKRMAIAFLVLLALTSAAAVILSLLIARGIARPIAQLTRLTRDFMRTGKPPEPIPVGGGEVGELTEAFLRMTADLEQSRENLVRAAKLAVVGEMAATMAHEVRTPLGIMRSSAQMLQREPALSATGQEMLGFILSENDRLTKLISSLLECARPHPPQFDEQHLHAIAKRVIGLLGPQARRKNIRLATDFSIEDDRLSCDGEQILQVLLNLVMNAMQILPQGGKIIMRSADLPEGLVMDVDDDGPGIPEAHRPKVFDLFFTQREGGIGIGLAVAQQIIRAHGADISATASPLGGARFRIVFPRPATL